MAEGAGDGPSRRPARRLRGRARSVLSAVPLILACALLLAAVARWGGHRTDASAEELARTLRSMSEGRPILLFAFQPADCPSFATLIERWEEIHRSGVARVVGVALEHRRAPPPSSAPELEFPVRSDLAREAERLILRLGYRRTPVSVLLDGEGRVHLALAAPPTPAAQAEAAGWVRERVARLVGDPTGGARPGEGS